MKNLLDSLNESIFGADIDNTLDAETSYALLIDDLNKTLKKAGIRSTISKVSPSLPDKSLKFEITGPTIILSDADGGKIFEYIENILKDLGYNTLSFESYDNDLSIEFVFTRLNQTRFLARKNIINYDSYGSILVHGGSNPSYKLDLNHTSLEAADIELVFGSRGYDLTGLEVNSIMGNNLNSLNLDVAHAQMTQLDSDLEDIVNRLNPEQLTIRYDKIDPAALETLREYYPKYPKGPSKAITIRDQDEIEGIVGIRDLSDKIEEIFINYNDTKSSASLSITNTSSGYKLTKGSI